MCLEVFEALVTNPVLLILGAVTGGQVILSELFPTKSTVICTKATAQLTKSIGYAPNVLKISRKNSTLLLNDLYKLSFSDQ